MVAILLFLALTFTQTDCPAYPIVRNGLQAFANGTPQVGTYTDAAAYLVGGLVYIETRCGLDAALEFTP